MATAELNNLKLKAEDVKLNEAFPEAVSVETRKGYSGYTVKPENLVEVATALRDRYNFRFLSAATPVHYLEQGQMEMVYHFYNLDAGGGAIVLHAQTSHDAPTIPSLTPVFPGADFQEREAWDLYGIKFPGHPNLKRILMWEGFNGHPMRKDWKEAYYEQDGKPYDTRWPGSRRKG